MKMTKSISSLVLLALIFLQAAFAGAWAADTSYDAPAETYYRGHFEAIAIPEEEAGGRREGA